MTNTPETQGGGMLDMRFNIRETPLGLEVSFRSAARFANTLLNAMRSRP